MHQHYRVISAMAHNSNVVVQLLIFQQVYVVLCFQWENKSYDVSSPSTANGTLRELKMLGKLFMQMRLHLFLTPMVLLAWTDQDTPQQLSHLLALLMEFLSNENARQTFQADVMASLLDALHYLRS